MPSVEEAVRELEYEEYQSRQRAELHQEKLELRAHALRAGNRAHWSQGRWTPTPYPGFAMQAMLSESSNRNHLCLHLQEIQHELAISADEPGTLYPLPPSSFHQTVANTFSADRLQQHLSSKGLETKFPEIIEKALRQLDPSSHKRPVQMRLIGLAIFGSAIGVLGTFDQAQDFQRIIDFRNDFYSQPQLSAIGLKRTRPFIGHLTLAYAAAPLTDQQKQRLVECVCAINERIRKESLIFEMPVARLHRYNDLSTFTTFDNYPAAIL